MFNWLCRNPVISNFKLTIFQNSNISVFFRIVVKERAACGGWLHCSLFVNNYLQLIKDTGGK
jgi:hypothetical protein